MLERTWSALCVLLLAGFAPAALATVCPGPAPSPPPVGVCSAQAGPGTFLLVEGTVLLPDEVLENGDVLVDEFGRIACAACDCSGEPGYATATRVSCPQGVVSPGLIDLTQALTYQSNPVTPDTGERYEHREDWRRGENGHTQFEVTPTNTVAHAHYAELRALLAGVTTLNGNRTSALPGFTRGFDTLDATAMGEARIDNERFPLGSTPVQQVGTCNYPEFPGAPPPDRTRILTIAEGIAPSSLNEWHCLNGSTVDGVDAIEAAPIAGLLALDAADGDLLYRRGASMIWTPRHAVRTFGHPGPVAAFHRVGVPITLGTMWSVSGSFQMLREMQCAADLDDTYLGGVFGTPGVWRMATVNAARALRADGSIGVIAPGRLADLVVFDARVRSGHEAVVRAETADVVLVMRAGLALYGESGPMATLGRPAPDCEALDVCGSPRLLCVQEEIGMSLGALTASVSPNPMPLFACGVPADEPTCIPSRPVPVNGSTVYSGIITGADADGDGIPDASDNCPTVFNPVRPVDDGVQSDVDGDGFGDECDLCPIEPGNQPCVRGVFRDGFE